MASHFYYNISERMMDADLTGCQKSCSTEEYSVETRSYLDVNYPSRLEMCFAFLWAKQPKISFFVVITALLGDLFWKCLRKSCRGSRHAAGWWAVEFKNPAAINATVLKKVIFGCFAYGYQYTTQLMEIHVLLLKSNQRLISNPLGPPCVW